MSNMLTPQQQLEYAKLELAQTKAENARLRKSMQENSRHGQRVARAYEDALLLATRHLAWQPTTRDALQGILTKRRWTNAIGLLRLARIYHRHQFTVHDLVSIETALERAKCYALESPAAYLARLPSHADDKQYRHGKYSPTENR